MHFPVQHAHTRVQRDPLTHKLAHGQSPLYKQVGFSFKNRYGHQYHTVRHTLTQGFPSLSPSSHQRPRSPVGGLSPSGLPSSAPQHWLYPPAAPLHSPEGDSRSILLQAARHHPVATVCPLPPAQVPAASKGCARQREAALVFPAEGQIAWWEERQQEPWAPSGPPALGPYVLCLSPGQKPDWCAALPPLPCPLQGCLQLAFLKLGAYPGAGGQGSGEVWSRPLVIAECQGVARGQWAGSLSPPVPMSPRGAHSGQRLGPAAAFHASGVGQSARQPHTHLRRWHLHLSGHQLAGGG